MNGHIDSTSTSVISLAYPRGSLTQNRIFAISIIYDYIIGKKNTKA
jgi:hypothetical protein